MKTFTILASLFISFGSEKFSLAANEFSELVATAVAWILFDMLGEFEDLGLRFFMGALSAIGQPF